MIKLSLARLEKEPVELIGEEAPEFLEIEASEQFRISAPVHYELAAAMVSGGVLVEGFVSTQVAGICGRCLYPVEDEVRTEKLTLFFDEIDNMEELDLTEDVRAEMLLALPMNLLCDEECAGLCPICGVDLNEEECDCEVEELPEEKDAGENPWSALDQLNL